MKHQNRIKRALALALLSGLLMAGCQPANSTLTVGRVDTAELLKEDPDYQSMSIEYIKAQTDIRKELVEKLRDAGDNKQKIKSLQDEYMNKQKEFEKKWESKTDDFIQKRHAAIRTTAESIAKRKKIDLVLIDSKMYPTVEWGGVDMTKDMSLAMSSGSQAPSATSTPSGEDS